MASSIQEVCNLFERYGWRYEVLDDQSVLSWFYRDHRRFVLIARLYGEWLTLNIRKYLPPVDSQRQADVCLRLLRLNTQIAFARFALEPDGTVMLMVDIPAYAKINYDLFSIAVDLLDWYGDKYYAELYQLITGEEPPAPKESPDE